MSAAAASATRSATSGCWPPGSDADARAARGPASDGPSSGGFHLKVPDSRSEEDFRIDIGWIVTSDRPGRDRLLEVIRAALSSVQAAVADTTAIDWPADTRRVALPEAHAEIAGDSVNPTLRLWYGPAQAPVLEFKPRILLNMILYH